MKRHGGFCQWRSNRPWSAFTDGAVTMGSGSPFHRLTIRCVCVLSENCASLDFLDFKSMAPRSWISYQLKNRSVPTSSIWWTILYNVHLDDITPYSPVDLRAGLSRLFSSGTILADRRWILFWWSMSDFVKGFLTT